MVVQRVPLAQLHLNDDNPRLIKEPRFKQLVKSLEEFPEMLGLRPLVVDETYTVLGGNMRLRAMQQLGYTECQVVVAEGLTEAKKREFVIKDNGSFGEHDWDALANGDWPDAATLNEWGVDVPADWGLVQELPAAEEGEPDLSPPVEPITVLGDLYELNGHRLHCADSTDSDAVAKLMDGKLADMVFTDPPYGVSFQSDSRKEQFDVLLNDDTILEIAPVVWLFMKDNTAAFIWTSHHVYPIWREQFDAFYSQTIIWSKGGMGMGDLVGAYALDYEMALFCKKGKPLLRNGRGPAVWSIGKDGNNTYVHPTQKPVELSERAIADFTDPKALVLDLFLGSGSTLIGCEKTGRTCYGQELGPNYCDVIVRRWVKYMQDNNRPYTVKRNGQVLSESDLTDYLN